MKALLLGFIVGIIWVNNSFAQSPSRQDISAADAQDVIIARMTQLDSGRVLLGTPSPRGDKVALVSQRALYGPMNLVVYSSPEGRRLQAIQLNLPAAHVAAWSPDGGRVYISGWQTGPGRVCGVVDLTAGRFTRLPGGCVDVAGGYEGLNDPHRRIVWVDDSTVVSTAHVCNLSSLVCRSPSPQDLAHLGSGRMTKVTISARVGPITYEYTSGGIQDGLFAVAQDSSFRALGFWERPVHIAHFPDPNVMVVASNRGAWLVTLGTSASGPLVVSIDSASFNGSVPWNALVAGVRNGGRLAATVHEPLRNPLNDRVTGANQRVVKARIRFDQAANGRLIGRVLELYQPIRAGDVLGSLSLKNMRGLSLSSGLWASLTAEHVRQGLDGRIETPNTMPIAGDAPSSQDTLSVPARPVSAFGTARGLEASISSAVLDSTTRRQVEVPATPSRVWDTLITMFTQSGYRTLRNQPAEGLLVMERSQRIPLLGDIVRQYHIAVYAPQVNAPSSTVHLALMYKRVTRPEGRTALDRREADKELDRTVANLLTNLR